METTVQPPVAVALTRDQADRLLQAWRTVIRELASGEWPIQEVVVPVLPHFLLIIGASGMYNFDRNTTPGISMRLRYNYSVAFDSPHHLKNDEAFVREVAESLMDKAIEDLTLPPLEQEDPCDTPS